MSKWLHPCKRKSGALRFNIVFHFDNCIYVYKGVGSYVSPLNSPLPKVKDGVWRSLLHLLLVWLVWSFSNCMSDHSCGEFMRANNHTPSCPIVCSYILSASFPSFPDLCCRWVGAVNIDVPFRVEHTLSYSEHFDQLFIFVDCYAIFCMWAIPSWNNPARKYKVSVCKEIMLILWSQDKELYSWELAYYYVTGLSTMMCTPLWNFSFFNSVLLLPKKKAPKIPRLRWHLYKMHTAQ